MNDMKNCSGGGSRRLSSESDVPFTGNLVRAASEREGEAGTTAPSFLRKRRRPDIICPCDCRDPGLNGFGDCCSAQRNHRSSQGQSPSINPGQDSPERRHAAGEKKGNRRRIRLPGMALPCLRLPLCHGKSSSYLPDLQGLQGPLRTLPVIPAARSCILM
jgi:hypothetical protein